jgi:hypothetical protein
MSNHRNTEYHFRRVESSIAAFVTAPDPTVVGLETVENRSIFTTQNDISICIAHYLRSNPTWESTMFTREQVADFHQHYVIRIDPARQLVIAAIRTRNMAPRVDPRHIPVTKSKIIANDIGEHQLSLGLNINDNLPLACAAATMLAAGYYTSPVAFLGHLAEAHEDALVALYPHVAVLRDTHPVYGDTTLLL